MRKVLVACVVFWLTVISIVICSAIWAKAEVLVEIHTDPFEGAIEISEPCPVSERVYADIALTDEEKQLLAAILWAEANNQKVEGQMACVEVVFNRMRSGEWGNGKPGQMATLESVLSQKGQFATWKYRNKVKPTQEQFDAIEAVLNETETVLPSTDYVYFDRRGKNGKDHVRIQDHAFGR